MGVPADCQKVVGKTIWQKTLGTRSKSEADRLMLPHVQEALNQIASIRNGTYRRFSNHELEGIAMMWEGEYRREYDAQMSLPPAETETEIALSGPASPLTTQEALERDLREFLDREQIEISAGSEDWFCLLSLAQQEHYYGFLQPQPVASIQLPERRQDLTPSPEHALTKVMEAFLSEKTHAKTTEHDYRLSAARFSNWIGDKHIGQITRDDAREYREKLKRFPSRVPPKLRTKSYEDVTRWADENDAKRLQADSINKALSGIRSCITWASDESNILPFDHTNPFARIKVQDNRPQSEKKLPFTVEDVRLIFANLPDRDRNPMDYWMPLLAAYTGARAEELAQIVPNDVTLDGKIWILRLMNYDDDDKEFKNTHSERFVPIHSKLIELGFLKFVEGKRSQPRLFDVIPDAMGRYSGSYTKRFGTLKKRLAIKGKKSFHSFRHTWKKASQSALIPEDVQEVIQGHASVNKVSRIVYGSELKTLSEVLSHFMEKISYDSSSWLILDDVELNK